jgi:outer membrane protein TolC
LFHIFGENRLIWLAMQRRLLWQYGHFLCLLAVVVFGTRPDSAAGEGPAVPLPVPPPDVSDTENVAAPPPVASAASILPPGLQNRETTPIDLSAALDLAGVRNPELLMARELVNERNSVRQFAAAQILPNLNAGTSFDSHSGSLQQSSGNILNVSRSANYIGGGANTVGPGTVNVPAVMWNQNIAQGVVTYLVSRQTLRAQRFASEATRNDVLRRVASAYVDLLRQAGRRAILLQIRSDTAEVARLTAEYANTGKGRPADADRAATELERRNAELLVVEGDVINASTRLAQLLNLDPTVELRPSESWVVPTPLVSDVVELPQLLALAYVRRPELAADRASIEGAILSLRGSQILAFSPTTMVGFSAGSMGGGSNLVPVRFGSYRQRTDFDVIAYWTLQSMGIGNKAMIDVSRSQVRAADFRRLQTLNLVREQVAAAYNRAQVRFASIDTAESAVRASLDAFTEDLDRVRNNVGLPIEVLDSLRLLANSRYEYLDAIAEYNRSQFELYVALGQPPVAALNQPAQSTPALVRKPAPKPPSPAELAAKIAKRDRVSPGYLPLKRWQEQAAGDQTQIARPDASPSRLAAGPQRAGRSGSSGSAPPNHRRSVEVPDDKAQKRAEAIPAERNSLQPLRQLSFVAAMPPEEAVGNSPPLGTQPMHNGDSELPPPPEDAPTSETSRVRAETIDAPPALARPENEYVIDLPAALRLLAAANPTLGEARELVRQTLALHTKARAMLIPSLNAGLMYHRHQGNFQKSDGLMAYNYTSSFYYGGGTEALAAFAPAIPMVRIFTHLGDALFEPLAVRQQVYMRRFDERSTANSLLLEAVVRYFELLSAEARLEAIKQSERELGEVVRISEHFVRTGEGRPNDLDRAEAEAYLMHIQEQQAEERIALASARLAALLSLDTSVRLKTNQGPIPGLQIVDTSVGLPELLRVAERRRPELAAGTATVEHAQVRVRQEKTRPLFPLVMLGYSSASFGGGSVLFPPELSNFRGRQDFDIMALWSLTNMGAGNVASVAERRALLQQAMSERTLTLNNIRQEVVEAYALVLGERTQIEITQRQAADAEQGFREELERLFGADALPIEVLNNVKQLAMARQELVEAVTGYNKAQFRLYVAIGFSPVRAVNKVAGPPK